MTRDGWYKIIENDLENNENRLMFAVWLQDDEDDLPYAEFQRWLVDKRIHPLHYPATYARPILPPGEYRSWDWRSDIVGGGSADISKRVLLELPLVRVLSEYISPPENYREFTSLRQAEEELFKVWLKYEGDIL